MEYSGQQFTSPQESLEHYGKRGMKWGVRRGKNITGVSRTRGAALDTNQRRIEMVKRLQSGKGTRQERITVGIGKAILGKPTVKKNLAFSLKNARAQRNRIELGKTTLADKIQLFQTTPTIDLVVSRTAGHR